MDTVYRDDLSYAFRYRKYFLSMAGLKSSLRAKTEEAVKGKYIFSDKGVEGDGVVSVLRCDESV